MMINKDLFKHLEESKAPNYLMDKILVQIAFREKRIAKFRFGIFVTTLFASVALFIPVFSMLWNDMASSGSTNYISLLFSNFSDVMDSWTDYLFSVFESLPMVSIAIFLMIVFVMMLSLSFLSKDIKRVFQNNNYLKI